MTPHQIRCVQADFDLLSRTDDPDAPPSAAWEPFLAETDPDTPSEHDSCDDVGEEDPGTLRVRPLPKVGTHKETKELKKGAYRRLDRSVVPGRYVAIDTNTGQVNVVDKIAVGKITKTNTRQNTLQVDVYEYYGTSTTLSKAKW